MSQDSRLSEKLSEKFFGRAYCSVGQSISLQVIHLADEEVFVGELYKALLFRATT